MVWLLEKHAKEREEKKNVNEQIIQQIQQKKRLQELDIAQSKAEDEEIELLSSSTIRDILVAPLSRDLKQDGGFISDNVSCKFIIQKQYTNNKRWVWSILFILFM